jgi:hypothetical protein
MSHHSDILDRLAALQEETIAGCEAFTRDFAWSETPPYWTNRLGPATYEWNSEDICVETRQVISKLVVGHLTQGYQGEVEDDLYGYVQDWIDKIADKDGEVLVGTTYTTVLDCLYPEAPCSLITDTGLEYFIQPGLQVVQVGVEFTHEIRLMYDAT